MSDTVFKHGSPLMMDHAPSSAVAAGEVVVVSDMPFIAHRPIAANELGAIAGGGGVYQFAVGGAVSGGVDVYWDDTGKVATTTATDNQHLGQSAPGGSYDSDSKLDVIHRPKGITGS